MVLAWRACRVRETSRCDNRQRPRPHHYVTFEKRYTMARLRPPSAATTARISHATHAPCEHHFL
eukprot:7038716-Lingulodinium_polyedra.AAC.1